MDAAIVARWRALCLVLLGAFLGMSLVIGAVGLLPGDVPLHDEILKGRGTALHAIARWVDYGGKWIVLGAGHAAPLRLVARRPPALVALVRADADRGRGRAGASSSWSAGRGPAGSTGASRAGT